MRVDITEFGVNCDVSCDPIVVSSNSKDIFDCWIDLGTVSSKLASANHKDCHFKLRYKSFKTLKRVESQSKSIKEAFK